MIMTSLVVSIILTIITLLLTILTITQGYKFKHTIDPLNEGDEVREYTDNGEHRRNLK